MNRTQLLISGLIGLLLALAFFFLLYQPKNDEIADLEEQQAQFETQAAQLQGQIAALEQVRLDAPNFEAQLSAAEAVVPRSAALPSALRQLQTAADASGINLLSVSPGRPAAVAGAPGGLALIKVNITVSGGYFQLVDFLRRIEDPAITARGFAWDNVSVSSGEDEYPTLLMSLSGRIFAAFGGAS